MMSSIEQLGDAVAEITKPYTSSRPSFGLIQGGLDNEPATTDVQITVTPEDIAMRVVGPGKIQTGGWWARHDAIIAGAIAGVLEERLAHERKIRQTFRV